MNMEQPLCDSYKLVPASFFLFHMLLSVFGKCQPMQLVSYYLIRELTILVLAVAMKTKKLKKLYFFIYLLLLNCTVEKLV